MKQSNNDIAKYLSNETTKKIKDAFCCPKMLQNYEENYPYQNVNSTAHFVVDVVISFGYYPVIKESGKQLCNCINKGQPNTGEIFVVC